MGYGCAMSTLTLMASTNWLNAPDPIRAPQCSRDQHLQDVAAMGRSIVGYVAISALAWGDAQLQDVTVHCRGDIDRTAHVLTWEGVAMFVSIDGDWFDTSHTPLLKADAKILDDAATRAVGG